MKSEVVVCIPVYNAFPEALLCLESVVRHTDSGTEVIVIDDASPDGDFLTFLKDSPALLARVKVIRNKENLGFVKTSNRALLELSGAKDVILLNSDTEVTAGWINKLNAAAYSKENVATVTPLTNNGTICSFPNFGADNSLPSRYSLDQFSELVERVSAREYPELPTCVGFCVYIRRSAVEKIGGFDAEAFGKGYGEENDFSCRAKAAGMIDILDDATFIYHKGNMSFQAARSELSAAATEVIQRRHPTYFGDVGRFCRAFPLHSVHQRIKLEMVRKWGEQCEATVLHILHNGPRHPRHHPLGGTELHVLDLISQQKRAAHWSLVRHGVVYFLTAHYPDFDFELLFDVRITKLSSLIEPKAFEVVHLHHARGLNYAELASALQAHGNYIVSFHDFFTICPRVNLLTPTRVHCSGKECKSACGFGDEYIRSYRGITMELIRKARQRVVFSKSTASYFDRILGQDFDWDISPHGIQIEGMAAPSQSQHPQIDAAAPFRVTFLGFIPQHKGQLIIEELVKTTRLKNGREIEWSVIGKFFGKLPAHVKQLGVYDRTSLSQLFAKANPDLVAILSICPETYCLTLDEAWSMGTPVLVSPLGAPAERVKARAGGWVLSSLTVPDILSSLNQIAQDKVGYAKVVEQVRSIKLRPLADEVNSFERRYVSLNADRRFSSEALLSLSAAAIRRPPELSLFKKALKPMVNQGIITLERLRLRPVVERMAYGVIPRRFLESLKFIR